MSARKRKMTLGAYIDKVYWPIASRRLEATSLDTYEKEIRLRIKPHLGGCALVDIDRLAVQRMVDACATECVARKAVSTLKTILNEAVGDGYIASNPANARFAYPRKGKPRDNGVVLTDFGQIAYFLGQVRNDAPEAILRLVASGLLLGLRPEERYALDYEDLDFAELVVHVRSAYVTASGKHGGNQLKRTKTPLSTRVIPMPELFAELFACDGGHGPWVTGETGGRLSPSTAQKAWTRYLDAHPWLPRVTLENMRHSFATSCLNAGMHVEDVSRMLGHSDISTTYRRYVRPDLKNMREGLALCSAKMMQTGPPDGISPGQTHMDRSSILRASTSKLHV